MLQSSAAASSPPSQSSAVPSSPPDFERFIAHRFTTFNPVGRAPEEMDVILLGEDAQRSNCEIREN
jgi:hypothetical protein